MSDFGFFLFAVLASFFNMIVIFIHFNASPPPSYSSYRGTLVRFNYRKDYYPDLVFEYTFV